MNAPRVLIVRLGAFGDIVHTLPLAADLDAAGWRVDWLCEDRWSDLLDGNPAIDRVWRLPRRHGELAERRRWRRRLIEHLRGTIFDAVIDAQGLAKSAWWSVRVRSRRRIAHRPPRAREGSWIVAHRRTPVDAVHVIDQQRALALPLLGARHPRGPWRFPLPPWREEAVRMRRWWEERGDGRPWLANVGAGWPTKVWPRARWKELVELWEARGEGSVIGWGSPEEHAVAEMIAARGSLIAPPTTIPELAGLMRACRAVVSGDTGPLHLALALGVPAVGLFGPVPAERNGPRGTRYRNLQAPGAAWERRYPSRVAMDAIVAEEVLAKLEEVAPR